MPCKTLNLKGNGSRGQDDVDLKFYMLVDHIQIFQSPLPHDWWCGEGVQGCSHGKPRPHKSIAILNYVIKIKKNLKS